uniref:Uncharacterized protein n=1 Tax=Arundo donax TaxID=35708 RepID=A0A0A9FXF1_ARUDO
MPFCMLLEPFWFLHIRLLSSKMYGSPLSPTHLCTCYSSCVPNLHP